MSISSTKYKARKIRQRRVRRKVRGTDQKPRLCVYRSLRYTSAQLISDESNKVLCAFTSELLKGNVKSTASVDTAKQVGLKMAELAKAAEVKEVVFDRNGFVYHGRVAAVAEGAREGGLEF